MFIQEGKANLPISQMFAKIIENIWEGKIIFFIYLFIYLFIYSFIYLFIHSFIHSLRLTYANFYKAINFYNNTVYQSKLEFIINSNKKKSNVN